MNFGSELAALRRRTRLSQLALAERSGVSQRHISFLESGRSQPGTKSVAKIACALKLSYAEENALYLSAGLAPPRPRFELLDPGFAPARQVIETLLRQHDPYPAVATQRSGDIILSNQTFDAAISWAFEGDTPWRARKKMDADNLFELTLHPKGLRRFMLNPGDIITHTLRRLRRAAVDKPETRDVLARIEAYPGLHEYLHLTEAPSSAQSSVLIERYKLRGHTLNLVSMVASFGSPEDVTAQAIQIEMFFPDDEKSEKTLQRIAEA
ncbi:MAG: helix-turn-helix domain-containing protein [Pseudomonadota bacterium]